MTDIDRLVADRLNARREEIGATQRDVAARMQQHGHDWHQTTVLRTEKGQRPIRVAELASLAVALHTSMPDLLGLDDQVDRYAEHQAVGREALADELRASAYAGDIPGSVIHWEGYEVQVHTTEQVQSWLRDRVGDAS